MNVLVRLPDGRRLPPRRFGLNNTISSLYLYADIARTELELAVEDSPLLSSPAGLNVEGSQETGRFSFGFDLYSVRPRRLLNRVRIMVDFVVWIRPACPNLGALIDRKRPRFAVDDVEAPKAPLHEALRGGYGRPEAPFCSRDESRSWPDARGPSFDPSTAYLTVAGLN